MAITKAERTLMTKALCWVNTDTKKQKNDSYGSKWDYIPPIIPAVFNNLTQYLIFATQDDDIFIPHVSLLMKAFSLLKGSAKCQVLVKFFALYRTKKHTPLLSPSKFLLTSFFRTYSHINICKTVALIGTKYFIN